MTPCPVCTLLADGEVVTDAMTGTAYERCRRCGAHRKLSPGGYVDWHGGLWLDSPKVAGSAWTQQVSPDVMPEVSGWTTGKKPK